MSRQSKTGAGCCDYKALQRDAGHLENMIDRMGNCFFEQASEEDIFQYSKLKKLLKQIRSHEGLPYRELRIAMDLMATGLFRTVAEMRIKAADRVVRELIPVEAMKYRERLTRSRDHLKTCKKRQRMPSAILRSRYRMVMSEGSHVYREVKKISTGR